MKSLFHSVKEGDADFKLVVLRCLFPWLLCLYCFEPGAGAAVLHAMLVCSLLEATIFVHSLEVVRRGNGRCLLGTEFHVLSMFRTSILCLL